MTWLEIILLLIGLICVIASFIFSVKAEGEIIQPGVDVGLTDKQKNDIKAQIAQAFDETLDDVKSDCVEKTEVELDKLSNKKIQELADYSDTVLAEINRNHSEVMFLYDMLNEKSKEVHNNIRDISLAATKAAEADKKTLETEKNSSEQVQNNSSVQINAQTAAQNSAKTTVGTFVESGKTADKTAKTTKTSTKKDDKPAGKTTAKTEAKASKTSDRSAKKVKTDNYLEEMALASEDELLDSVDNIRFNMGGNKKEAILSLHNEGKSNVEIAKALGLGIGEVKLVIDLYKGQK